MSVSRCKYPVLCWIYFWQPVSIILYLVWVSWKICVCKTSSASYQKQGKESACCTSNGYQHQDCECQANVSFCKSACDRDMHCKGYVARNTGKCHIATTSKCTSFEGCRQYNSGYVGALDVDARCGSRRRRDRYNGCYIKERSNFLAKFR